MLSFQNNQEEREKFKHRSLRVAVVIRSVKAEMDQMVVDFPYWNPEKDVRITIFAKTINALKGAQLGLVHILVNLTQRRWWDFTFNDFANVSDKEIIMYKDTFLQLLKIGFIQVGLSGIESSFRIIFLEVLD